MLVLTELYQSDCVAMKPFVLILFCLLACSLLRCTQKHGATSKAFYIWQANPDLTASQLTDLRKSGMQTCYLRLFDVVWNPNASSAQPSAVFNSFQYNTSISFTAELAAGLKLVPVVFVENKVFQRLQNESDIADLAKNVATYIQKQTIRLTSNVVLDSATFKNEYLDIKRNGYTRSKKLGIYFWQQVQEIQIDCDWTESSKNSYFLFLKSLKQQLAQKNLSVTIRLYPYKYPGKAGVPPADKGVLMCYNLSDLTADNTKNSILDAAVLKSYLSNTKPYPLPLNVALPAFDWLVWKRGSEFRGLIRKSEILSPVWTKQISGTSNYAVITDTSIGTDYYRRGDIIRLEKPESQFLLAAAKMIKENLPSYPEHLILFHASSSNIQKYESSFQKCAEIFH